MVQTFTMAEVFLGAQICTDKSSNQEDPGVTFPQDQGEPSLRAQEGIFHLVAQGENSLPEETSIEQAFAVNLGVVV